MTQSMTPELTRFLKEADRLHETIRYQLLAKRDAYARGTQYEHRQLDTAGYRKGSPGVYGSMSRTPPWCERDPGAIWNALAEAISELTDWTLAGDSWCHLEIADDDEAEDWLGKVTSLANMSDVMAQARNYGGHQGTAISSFAWRNGELELESHDPKHCWVLAWRDARKHRPAAVVKVHKGENQLAKTERDYPLTARYWDEQIEALYERYWDESRREWLWRELESVAHGLGFCPLYWHPQDASQGSHDGTPDGGDLCDEQDEINELCAAASATTRRNADDTLVVKEDPALNPGKVCKGGYNVIFSRGGAEYLSQSGDSASVCEELAEKRAARLQRCVGVVMVDLETLGKATTGEALKRLFQRTIKTAGKRRRNYAKGLIVPLCRGILTSARMLLARGLVLDVPPRVEEDKMSGKTVTTLRTPGKSLSVECQWPDPFPPTIADIAAQIAAAVAATGGQQVLSLETVVAWLKSGPLPLSSVAEELERIMADKQASAELQATAIGLAAQATGEAGPVDEKKEAAE